MKGKSVLVLGESRPGLSELTERTRELGFRVVRALTCEDAIALAEERGFRYGPTLIDPLIETEGLPGAIRKLRIESASHTLTCIAVGPEPAPEIRQSLREAEIRLALWDPVGEHALRFQLNRAMSQKVEDLQRGAVRVPTDWSARIFSAGREKAAGVYSLSEQGAFLVTWRPSVTGAKIGLELPLPSGPVSLAGQVVYTNVPGNLQCDLLPLGMAVRFTDPPLEASGEIARLIDTSRQNLSV